MCTTGGNIFWALVLNPTVTSPSGWVAVGGRSSLQERVSGGTLATGDIKVDCEHIIESGFLSNNTDASAHEFTSRLLPGDKNLTEGDVISIVCCRVNGGTEDIVATMNCKEMF